MKRAALAMAVAALLACAATVMAQAPAGPPKPGPAYEKLSYFVGKWKGDLDVKPGPFGPGGKVGFTENCELYAGGFSVVCHADLTGPEGGTVKRLGILTYNPAEKVYTAFFIHSVPLAISYTVRVEGNTWTFTSEVKGAGGLVKLRVTIEPLPGGGDSVKFETAVDDGPWSAGGEGKRLPAK